MECDDVLALMHEQFNENLGLITWLDQRMDANRNRIETLKQIRCDSSIEWLNFIKSSKKMLAFIEYLRTAIRNYKSFAEIKKFVPMLDTLQGEIESNIQEMLI